MGSDLDLPFISSVTPVLRTKCLPHNQGPVSTQKIPSVELGEAAVSKVLASTRIFPGPLVFVFVFKLHVEACEVA